MDRFVVWIEGVDFSETLYDTNKLSVLRGASRALESMPEYAQRIFKDKKFGLAVSRFAGGASLCGLVINGPESTVTAAFDEAMSHLESDNLEPADVEPVAKEWVEDVIAYAPYGHMRFHGKVEKVNGDFAAAAARARAAVRVAQLRKPGIPRIERGAKPCEYDGLRAIETTVMGVGRTDVEKYSEYQVSKSSAARWHFGRSQRQRLYDRALGANAERHPRFTDDFRQLIHDPPKLPDGSALPEAVKGKIAVFFADGDGFGTMIEKMKSETFGYGYEAGLKLVTDTLETNMFEKLLGGITKKLLQDAHDPHDPERAKAVSIVDSRDGELRLRFETILFGGDDVTFIVPAWLGFRLARAFFKTTGDWKFTLKDGSDEPMRFSAGLVFANHKTPIRSLRKIAKELCDNAKAAGGGLDIEALESIEPPHGGVMAHRRRLTGAADAAFVWPRDDDYIKTRFKALESFWIGDEATSPKKEAFPASQAHHALRAARDAGGKIAEPLASAAAVNRLQRYADGAGAGHKPHLLVLGLLPENAAGPADVAFKLYRFLHLRDYAIAGAPWCVI